VYSATSPARNRLLQGALALILGGALGNLYDRLTYGYVIDFVELYVGTYHWPAFNVADSAITTGVVLLGLEILRNENPGRA
jgi:signal peptidase II